MARACPISFCAIEEKATSSSSTGAIPVHSESRQPRTSSSSARARSCSRSFTGLRQFGLQRVAVDPVVVLVQLVDEVLALQDRSARHDPEADGFAAPPVLLVRIRPRERLVRRDHRAGVLERHAFPLLPEDLPDHGYAASASTTRRTHAVSSRETRRNSSRSAVFGPCPVTTDRSSSQSGSVYSHTPSSRLRSFGSVTASPSSQICGT